MTPHQAELFTGPVAGIEYYFPRSNMEHIYVVLSLSFCVLSTFQIIIYFKELPYHYSMNDQILLDVKVRNATTSFFKKEFFVHQIADQ